METIKDIALRYLQEVDSFQTIDFLSQQTDALAASKAYAEIVRYLYWEKKDLLHVIMLARAGIQQALMAAHASANTDTAMQLRSAAKALAYDLGSFTWPGWDEPGIAIAPAHLPFGLDAAQTNLRLAIELNKGDLPLFRARWLLGAHWLAAGEYAEAHREFEVAAAQAEQAGAETESQLAVGFQYLADALTDSDAAAAPTNFESLKARLDATEEGKGYAEQLTTAWRVFVLNRKKG